MQHFSGVQFALLVVIFLAVFSSVVLCSFLSVLLWKGVSREKCVNECEHVFVSYVMMPWITTAVIMEVNAQTRT